MKHRAFRIKSKGRSAGAYALGLFGLLAVVLTGLFGVFGLPGQGSGQVQAATGIYHTINFQGKVVNTNGTNVADGTYTFRFRIYTSTAPTDATNSCSANSCQWEESKSLTTVNGIFQTNLGDVTALPGAINFNTDTEYIGVLFNGDTEMSPRIRLTAVPYAFNADMLDGLDSTQLVQLTPSSQQTGTINVSGNITSGGAVNTAAIDAATASTVLTVGSTNASSVTLGKNTNLGSGLVLSLQGSNALSLGSTTAAGGIVFKDGTVNNRAVTIQTPALTASYTLNLPTTAPASGTLCLQTASGSTTNLTFGACSGGATNFVSLQSGTPGTADTGNLNISGIGIASAFDAGTFDTATASLMNIGTTNANQMIISKGGVNVTILGNLTVQDTSIAAGKSLTFVAGAGNFNMAASTGTFATGTGAISLNGDTTAAAGKSISYAAGAGNFDQSLSTGTHATGTGAVSLNGSTTVAGTKNFTVTSGASSLTGLAAGSSTALNVATGAASNKGLVIKGAASPTANAFEVQTSASATPTAQFNFNGDLSIGSSASSDSATALKVAQNGGGSVFVVDANNGRVGIGSGASAPSATLQVAGGFTQSGGAVSITNTGFTSTSSAATVYKTSTNSSSAFQVQNANSTPLFGVDTTAPASNLISNPGFELGTVGSTPTTWTNKVGGTLTRQTSPSTALYYGLSYGSLAMTTANGGAAFPLTLTLGTTYNLSFYARSSSGTISNINVGYTNAGGDQNCLTSQTVSANGFTRVSCSFTVTTTAGTAIYVKENSALTETLYLDAFQVLSGASAPTPYNQGTIQLRGIVTTATAFQNATDSTTALQIQNAAGTSNLFVADTLNGRIGIGTATPGFLLDVVGDINIASGSVYRINGTQICSATGCTPTSGSTNYIQNTLVQQASSNFNVSGTGIASIFQAGTFDTPSGTATLAIGTTNATSGIILNQSTSLAANKNITYAAGNGTFDQSASTGTFASGTGNVSLNGSTTVASGKTLIVNGDTTIKDTSTTALQIQNTAGTATIFGFDSSAGTLTIGSGAARTIQVATAAASTAGSNLTVTGGGATTTGFSGGNLTLTGGAGVGSGVQGLVSLAPTTFTASALQTNTITAGFVDTYSSIPVTANTTGVTVTVPSPVNATIGRVLYVTAISGSNDFTLLLSGTSISIAIKANSTATLIWNGTGWTAAGASSSTDLQSAYNNTLTSAGGAELVLNNTSSSNGFTIRNNAASPIIGAEFEVQSATGANHLSVNNNAVELASNGGAETTSTFATNWVASGSSTVTRNTTLANVATGIASTQVAATAAVNAGVANVLSSNPAVSTTYQVSFTGYLNSGTFTTMDVEYSRDGGTTLAPCTYSTSTGSVVSALVIAAGVWSKVTCTFTTDATTATSPRLIVRQTDATSRTYWLDNLSVTILSSTSTPPNVQVGGGLYGGAPTLLTLDSSSTAPVAAGNNALLGSMYYNTTSGRIQCYEAKGWGTCGASPDNYVNLVPEYAGAVLATPGTSQGVSTATGVGTLTAEFCSNQSGILQVAISLCNTGQALNYYHWTSPQASLQTYSIYVTYQLPAAFKQFQSDTTVQLTARTDNATNGAVTYEMFRSEGGTLTRCWDSTSAETAVTSSANAWQTVGINGNELSGCGFTTASANNFVIFKINVKAKSNANVYVGTLSFTTNGQ